MGNISQLKPDHHTARDEVAASVRAFIARAGVSKSAVARATGFTQSTFSRRANGLEPFNVDELGAIADYFGVDLIDLISGEVNKIPPNAKKAPTQKGEGSANVPPLVYKSAHSAQIIPFPTRKKDTLAPHSTTEMCAARN